MLGRLTTHVLDIASSRPAEHIAIELYYLGENDRGTSERRLLGTFTTNSDGRVDRPLLQGDELRAGVYELVFDAGGYLKRSTSGEADGLEYIFEQIPIRFRISNTSGHYHVPLLVAPGGYSTYRGS